MTFHHLRAPRPAVAPPAAPQFGPVTLALRAMREAVEAPQRTGPVTDAIRTMRAANPAFDLDPDLRALRRALADRIEGDLATLDALDGDADLEDEGHDEPSFGMPYDDEREHDESEQELTLGWCENVGQLALGPNTEDGDATALENLGAGFVRSGHEDDEDSHDAEGNTDDNGIGDDGGMAWVQGETVTVAEYDRRNVWGRL